MRLTKHIKKNKGSSLTMVLFMLFLLSVTAIAVITLTGSELSMSVMSSDRSKALLVAQAGAEKAAQLIDEAVAQAQEDARVLASEVVQDSIASFKECTEVDEKKTPKVPIPKGSTFDGVLDNYSTPGEIKILDEAKLNDIYETEYKYWFNLEVNKKLAALKTSELKVTTANYISKEMNADGTFKTNLDGTFQYREEDGSFEYVDVDIVSNDPILTSLDSSEGSKATTTSIKLKSIGEYKSPSNGSTYKRSIEAEFGLLTKTIAGSGGTSSTFEIPVSYGQLTKVRVNKDNKPSILKDKALIAQKNIISVDGMVNVIGDMVCFGTIPTKGTGEIDYGADAYKFGGIMAGITTAVWDDVKFGNGTTESLETNFKNAGDFNLLYGYTNYSGSFNVTGNATTSAYAHTLYSTSSDKHSDITVSGNTFARSINVESGSKFSKINFKNVFTIDDLRIDAHYAEVKIGGWKENSTTPVPLGSESEGLLVGLNKGSETNKTSSSVIVAGDSKLYINGTVYVGGSTLYHDHIYANGNEYISGMSIQKSDSKPARAFEKYNLNPTKIDVFPGDVFYLYDNTSKEYTNVNGPGSEDMQKLTWEDTYKDPSDTATRITMMKGSGGIPDTNNPPTYTQAKKDFYIEDRAMHLKYIWEKIWKSKPEYASYFNTGDIIIEPKTGEKLQGFCYGGVAANGTIYGPFGGFTDNDFNYREKLEGWNSDYGNSMDLFLDGNKASELNLANPTKKLSGNLAATDDWINKAALSTPTNPDFFKETPPKTIMYYGSRDVVLTNNSVGDGVNKNIFSNSNGRGIVYSAEDIYVKAGTNFKGILIAEGNIVFVGDSDIEYDEEVVDILLSESSDVEKFFKYSASDIVMNDSKAIVQTIKKADVKNIKIITWKEI